MVVQRVLVSADALCVLNNDRPLYCCIQDTTQTTAVGACVVNTRRMEGRISCHCSATHNYICFCAAARISTVLLLFITPLTAGAREFLRKETSTDDAARIFTGPLPNNSTRALKWLLTNYYMNIIYIVFVQ